MSQDINESLLDVKSYFSYQGRPVARIECDGFRRAMCGKEVACVAIVDYSRGKADQISDLKIGLCGTAIQLGAMAALDLLDVPPIPVASE